MADPIMIGSDPYTMQLQDIQQRKAMAQALQQQALAPQQQQVLHSTTGGDLVVKNGIAPSLAKIGEAYFAGKMGQQQNEAAQGVLANQQKATGDWMQNVSNLQAPDPLQAINVTAKASDPSIQANVDNVNANANQDNQDAAYQRRGQLLSTLAQGAGVSPMAGAIGGQLASQMITPKPSEFNPVDLGDRIAMVNKTTGAMVGQPLMKNASPDVQARVAADWNMKIAELTNSAREGALNRQKDVQLNTATNNKDLTVSNNQITAANERNIRDKDTTSVDPITGRSYTTNAIQGTVRDVATGQFMDPSTGNSVDPTTGKPNGIITGTPNPTAPGAQAINTDPKAAQALTRATAAQAHFDYLRDQIKALRANATGGFNNFGTASSATEAGQNLSAIKNALNGAILEEAKNDSNVGRLTNYDANQFINALPDSTSFGMTQSKYNKALDNFQKLIDSQEAGLHKQFPTYNLHPTAPATGQDTPGTPPGSKPPLSSFQSN